MAQGLEVQQEQKNSQHTLRAGAAVVSAAKEISQRVNWVGNSLRDALQIRSGDKDDQHLHTEDIKTSTRENL
jgi:hypothetical protein